MQALKEQDGGPIGVGGATLAASLTAHGVIDEYRLFVTPVVLGAATPFFAGDTHIDLKLIQTRSFSPHVVYLRYRRNRRRVERNLARRDGSPKWMRGQN